MNEESELYQRLYEKILTFLSIKPRSEKETIDRIKKYLSSSDVYVKDIQGLISRIITSLKEYKYLNDTEFVDLYISEVLRSKKTFSITKIRTFLLKKGISKDLIEKAVSRISYDYEYDCAKRDAIKKLNLLKSSDNFTKKYKISNYLKSRGYTLESIHRVVDSLL